MQDIVSKIHNRMNIEYLLELQEQFKHMQTEGIFVRDFRHIRLCFKVNKQMLHELKYS